MLRVAPARPLAFFAFYRRRLRFHHRYPHLFSFLFPLWNVIPTFGVDAVPTFASLFRTSPVPSIAFSSPRLARGVSSRRLSLSFALGSALIVDPRVGARDGAHGVTEKLQVGTRFHRRRARDFGCRNGCRRAAGPGRARAWPSPSGDIETPRPGDECGVDAPNASKSIDHRRERP